MPSLRIVFAGTPAFAATHLQSLLSSRHQVIAVYTQPDRPAGRGRQLTYSAVKTLATEHGIPVLQPATLRDPAEHTRLQNLNPDLMVVVAYGLLLPPAVLAIPRFGCLNVHASLLPRWRGAAPIERAILAGDGETGVTIMRMDAGLDTGAMLYKTPVKIQADDDRLTLEEKLAGAGKRSLLHVLDHLDTLLAHAEAQDNSQATYAAKLDKSEAEIDWRQSAQYIDRQIRAGIGRSPAYSMLGELRVRILSAIPENKSLDLSPGRIIDVSSEHLRVACGEGVLCVKALQLPGKNMVSVQALLNSHKDVFRAGASFSSPARPEQ